ncbi:MAG TPA: LuxR C-terminal-related transcriptional regulator, partial [Chloroflexota bacterium]|nr:LuxR C-terminal-related transcriptional regulator [Chloroflexota bacterium]
YGAPPWAHLARWWLAQGDVAAAARWVQQARLSPDMAPGVRCEAELMTLVRVLLAQDQAETAMGLLERLLRAAEAGERWRSVVEALALRALAHRAQGNLSEARRALARALTLAEPEGYVRTFVDEGAPMAALLDEPATRAVAPEYVARLRAAFREQAPPSPPAPAAGPGMVEALSAREMEVLRLVDAGRSNVEIARALHVTPGTVKVHLRNIYGKLDARRRTEALARARALGLLPASAAPAAPA